MGNFKKTSKKKTIEIIETYHLTKEVKYCIKIVNDKEEKRFLKYTGKKLYGYDLKPLYKEDRTLLKETNPCWERFDWLKSNELPDVDKIDINNIFFLQFSSHDFFELDKSPIPVYHKADYMKGFDNINYDLEKLRSHLLNHPNVLEVSDIIDIPHYNCDYDEDEDEPRNKHITFSVLPTKEILEKGYSLGKTDTNDMVFGIFYNKNSIDFLNIRQFMKV